MTTVVPTVVDKIPPRWYKRRQFYTGQFDRTNRRYHPYNQPLLRRQTEKQSQYSDGAVQPLPSTSPPPPLPLPTQSPPPQTQSQPPRKIQPLVIRSMGDEISKSRNVLVSVTTLYKLSISLCILL